MRQLGLALLLLLPLAGAAAEERASNAAEGWITGKAATAIV